MLIWSHSGDFLRQCHKVFKTSRFGNFKGENIFYGIYMRLFRSSRAKIYGNKITAPLNNAFAKVLGLLTLSGTVHFSDRLLLPLCSFSLDRVDNGKFDSTLVISDQLWKNTIKLLFAVICFASDVIPAWKLPQVHAMFFQFLTNSTSTGFSKLQATGGLDCPNNSWQIH